MREGTIDIMISSNGDCHSKGATPIFFVDPRGKSPVDNYERFNKEWDFQPTWPFVDSLYVFPDGGEIVCFPSWLIHNVPSHFSKKTFRVVLAANLQTSKVDGWFQTV